MLLFTFFLRDDLICQAVKLGVSMKRKRMYLQSISIASKLILEPITVNREETPSSLLIVRPQDSQSQPTNPANIHPPPPPPPPPRFSSQPSTSSILPQQPPSKKFRADSQTRTHQRRASNAASDVEVEKDVRAMDDEADKLRRLSRARTVIDPSILPSQGNVRFSETPGSSRKGTSSKAVDVVVPLPEEETPKIERNKQMRAGAMAAIVNGRNQEMTPHAHRRKSSVSGRGKRVSTSFEATGIISKSVCLCIGLSDEFLFWKRNHIIRSRRVVFTSILMLTFRTASVYVNCLSGALYARFLGTRLRKGRICRH